MNGFVEREISSDTSYVVKPRMRLTQYPISSENWIFKTLNRDFVGTSRISDAFAIHCMDADQDLWYVPQLDVYIYGAKSTNGVLDMVYEQYGDRLYVLFDKDASDVYDNHIYAYDNVAATKTFKGFVILNKETANKKIATFNSMCLTDDKLCFDRMFLDYFRTPDQ